MTEQKYSDVRPGWFLPVYLFVTALSILSAVVPVAALSLDRRITLFWIIPGCIQILCTAMLLIRKRWTWMYVHVSTGIVIIIQLFIKQHFPEPLAYGILAVWTLFLFMLNLKRVSRMYNIEKGYRVLVGILISDVFLYLAFRGTPFRQIKEAIMTVEIWWIPPAILVYFAAIWIRTVRWRYLMKPVKKCSTRSLFPVYVISYMANNVLPLRMGDVYRAYFIGKKESVSKAAALMTIGVERIFDGLTMIIFLAIASLMFPFEEDIRTVLRFAALAFIPMMLFCYVLIWKQSMARRLFHFFTSKLPDKLSFKLDKIFDSFFLGLGALKGPRDIFFVIVYSILTWLTEAVMYHLFLLAFQLSLPFHVAVSALAVVNLGIIIPAGPGYMGTFEYFCVLILGPRGYGAVMGITKDVARAYALLLHIVGQWIPSTLLGIWYMWREHLSFSEVKSDEGGIK